MAFDTAHGDGHHFDILITDDDLTLDDTSFVVTTDGRPSIAQDVKHAVRESQLLVSLIGERNPIKRKMFLRQIETIVEDDLRIIPGTASVTEYERGKIWIQADTIEYQHIDFYL